MTCGQGNPASSLQVVGIFTFGVFVNVEPSWGLVLEPSVQGSFLGALNPGILMYLLYTLHVSCRVPRILLEGFRAHIRGPYWSLEIAEDRTAWQRLGTSLCWLAAVDLKLSYHQEKTMEFAISIYQFHGSLISKAQPNGTHNMGNWAPRAS